MTSGHMVPSGGATEKIPIDTTGNRSRDRPTISTVPQLLHHPRPLYMIHSYAKMVRPVNQPRVASFFNEEMEIHMKTKLCGNLKN